MAADGLRADGLGAFAGNAKERIVAMIGMVIGVRFLRLSLVVCQMDVAFVGRSRVPL